jgi:glutamate racemase
MWVPIVENNETESEGADHYVKKNLDRLLAQDPEIDTIVLGCTHYPLLDNKIRKYLPKHIQLLSQGELVADSLGDYLERHPEIENKCSKGKSLGFYTTDSPDNFNKAASLFFGKDIRSEHLAL